MRIQVQKILVNGKAFLLAGDAGVEGVQQFNLETINPQRLLDIALEGHCTGIILNPGIAEKYHHNYYKDIPLIVNVTAYIDGRPTVLSGVDRAMHLGASAICLQAPLEHDAFCTLVEHAHAYGLPVIVRLHGQGVDALAREARLFLELGADMFLLSYNGDAQGLSWIIKSAGVCKVLCYEPDEKELGDAMQAGASGCVLGKKLWQHEQAITEARRLRKTVMERT